MIEGYIEDVNELRRFLRTARELSGLTVSDVTRLTGIDYHTLRRIEENENYSINVEKLLMLLNGYGLALHIEPKEPTED